MHIAHFMRRGNVYYYRRTIPTDIQQFIGKTE
ncbi:MAG: DUF6538 domain-containing protein [Thermodesulfobacteriota bacterium]|nr:DUF6538 domain-containing protein [Thermodesulfobacteriota bacterium]